MNVSDLKFQSIKELSIVQFRTENRNTLNYISLSSAIKDKHLEVKEISESGSVNNLVVINYSPFFAFLSDGDILSGAKQNRVLNTSVFIAPNSRTVIPVSCIEEGRWSYKSSKFCNTDYVAPVFMRSQKAADVKLNLKESKSFSARQDKLWEKVSEYEKDFNLYSTSSNLSDIFDSKKDDFESFIKEIQLEKGSNGIAIFIRNKILNLEIFNRTDIYDEYFTKILKSAYFEVYKLTETNNKLTEDEAFYKTKDFLDKRDTMKYEIHNGVGAGTEKRFDMEDTTGFELSYENRMIHFVALNLNKTEESKEIKR